MTGWDPAAFCCASDWPNNVGSQRARRPVGGGEAGRGIWTDRWGFSSSAHLWAEGKWTSRQERGAGSIPQFSRIIVNVTGGTRDLQALESSC